MSKTPRAPLSASALALRVPRERHALTWGALFSIAGMENAGIEPGVRITISSIIDLGERLDAQIRRFKAVKESKARMSKLVLSVAQRVVADPSAPKWSHSDF